MATDANPRRRFLLAFFQIVAALIGIMIGQELWDRLFLAFQEQVSEDTLLEVSQSQAFGMICGFAGVLIILGIGFALAWVVGELVTQFYKLHAKSRSQKQPSEG